VYCADLQGSPREYLTLPYGGEDTNFSMFAPASGTAVVTHYDKIRIDPVNGTVDIGVRGVNRLVAPPTG
jgi:hypothetical protein